MTKIEIADLLDRLGSLYQPIRLLRRHAFPLLQVARARVWRGWPLPDEDKLQAAMLPVEEVGVPRLEVSALVAMTETLFRPLKAVELRVERDLPAFAEVWTRDSIPGQTYQGTPADVDFLQLWNQRTLEVGDGWVLAAGMRPIWIGGKPTLVAPRVAGAVVAERLQLHGVAGDVALKLAADLESVLAGSQSEPERVKHWRDIYRGIVVRVSHAEWVPLTKHLAFPLRVLKPELLGLGDYLVYEALDAMPPADYLTCWRLPNSACADFAGIMWRGPFRQRRGGGKRRSGVDLFSCYRCDSEEMVSEAFWSHLQDAHGINAGVVEIPEGRNEVWRRADRSLLAKWRRAPEGAASKTHGRRSGLTR